MEGDVATAIALDELGAAQTQVFRVDEEVLVTGEPPEGVNRGVFQQGQDIGCAFAYLPGSVSLPGPGFAVREQARSNECYEEVTQAPSFTSDLSIDPITGIIL